MDFCPYGASYHYRNFICGQFKTVGKQDIKAVERKPIKKFIKMRIGCYRSIQVLRNCTVSIISSANLTAANCNNPHI